MRRGIKLDGSNNTIIHNYTIFTVFFPSFLLFFFILFFVHFSPPFLCPYLPACLFPCSCTFYRFEQIYKWYVSTIIVLYRVVSLCKQSSILCLFISNPWQPLILYCLVVLSFRMLYGWNNIVCNLLRLTYFT